METFVICVKMAIMEIRLQVLTVQAVIVVVMWTIML